MKRCWSTSGIIFALGGLNVGKSIRMESSGVSLSTLEGSTVPLDSSIRCIRNSASSLMNALRVLGGKISIFSGPLKFLCSPNDSPLVARMSTCVSTRLLAAGTSMSSVRFVL
uniref:(northern house mosquito) hypothetical protein n=1 Tax=Culex pipiens TaxID=7175 RepID=A0A8D8CWC6_CULPI